MAQMCALGCGLLSLEEQPNTDFQIYKLRQQDECPFCAHLLLGERREQTP